MSAAGPDPGPGAGDEDARRQVRRARVERRRAIRRQARLLVRQQARRTLIGDGLAIGIDIGGTKVAAGVVDGQGRILQRARRATPTTSARAVEDVITELVTELGDGQDVVSVGIGAAGFVDAARSTVLFSPHLAWRNEPLRDAVERRVRERLGRRVGRRTVVENDANAAAWAEYRFGAGRGESRLVCLTLGTGIGGGIIHGGRLQRGRHGLAGEFGHMVAVPGGHPCECGARGCWEQYASGNALGRLARDRAAAGGAGALLALAGGDPAALTGEVVTRAARDGDPVAVEVVRECGVALGRGLVNLAAALDPGTFVIGGGAGQAGDLILGPARRAFRQELTGATHRPLAAIVPARLGSDAGVVGAADLSRGWG